MYLLGYWLKNELDTDFELSLQLQAANFQLNSTFSNEVQSELTEIWR